MRLAPLHCSVFFVTVVFTLRVNLNEVNFAAGIGHGSHTILLELDCYGQGLACLVLAQGQGASSAGQVLAEASARANQKELDSLPPSSPCLGSPHVYRSR